MRSGVGESRLVGHFIAGRELSDDGRTQELIDPANGVPSGRVCMAGRATVERAIAAAADAAPAWAATPPARRAGVMFRFRELLERHAEEICCIVTLEHGKVLHDARGELRRGLEVVEYACGIAELLKGEHSREAGPGIDSWAELQALGVVAGITPFNFPVMVPMWMYPLAIACGNSFVLKPSEKDPGASLLIARLLREAGLPDGVFNVVNGDREAVEVLLDDERVQAVSFVGSTAIAESIYSPSHRHRQTCASARRRQEPCGCDAGRRSGSRRRRAHGRRLWFLRPALHGDFSGGGGGRRNRRPASGVAAKPDRRLECRAGQ